MGKHKKKEAEKPQVAAIDCNAHKLAAIGALDKLTELIEAGTEVDAVDEMMCTPLLWAARAGQAEVVTYLLDKGADIKHKGYGGMNSLHHAANNMREAVTKLLLEKGAEVDEADDQGNTAMHWNATRGVMATAIVLHERGADMNKPNAQGCYCHSQGGGQRAADVHTEAGHPRLRSQCSGCWR